MTLTNWCEIVFYGFCLLTIIQVLYHFYFFSRLAFFKQSQKANSQTHPITVIVCARDEATNLAKNLPAILAQEYMTTHEVVAVNDNSHDDSKYVLEFLTKDFKHLRSIELKQEARLIHGKKFPLSIGIKEAKHEIVLLTDADGVPASEHWISKMQEGFAEGKEIVIGYGPFFKNPGILNKLIRFESFLTALQYFSYALAGIPYMAVGRNLAYKKELFFRNKGFSAHNNIAGGDDDLFINKVANKKNIGVMLDPESFVYSESKKTWSRWVQQKKRHYSTGRYYKPKHKFLLGLYSLTWLLYYPVFIVSLIFYGWKLTLIVFGVRYLIQFITWSRSMTRLKESDLLWLYPFLDIWQPIYFLIFSFTLWKKPATNWS